MYKNNSVAVVVPAYNEQELIKPTLETIPDYVDVVYAVDDCSIDQTYDIMTCIASVDKRIKVIRREVNGGVGAAIVSGYKKSIEEHIDIVVVMAGDNQMDPQYLPVLIDPIVTGEADFTKGNRLKFGLYDGMSRWRLFGNLILTYLTKIASGYWNISDPQNGYVAINVNALVKMDLDNIYRGYAFENDMMVKANILNLKMMNVDIPARYGLEKSKIKYGSFIFKTSYHLLRSFFWRIYKKHILQSEK